MRAAILRNTVSGYAAKLTELTIALVLTPFVLGHLGAASYGLWVLVGALVGYGSLLDLAISAAIVKYVAEHRARGDHATAREIVATALALHLAVAAVLVLATVVAAPALASLLHVDPEQRTTALALVMIMGVSVALAIPCTAPSAVLRGLQRFDLVGALSVTSAVLSAVGIVMVLRLGGGVLGLALVNLAVLLGMQIPTLWLVHRAAPELPIGLRGASIARLREVMRFSTSLFVINVAHRLESRTDEIVIGTLLPVSTVTPYALAHRLSELPQMLTDQFMRVLPPLASALDAGADHDRMRRLYLASTRLTLAAFLPIAGALTALAGPILALWVGAEYAAHGHLVGILALASLIETSQWPGGSLVQGMARHRPLAVLAVVSGLANLGLSIVLCRRFGLLGVALGTLIPAIVVGLGLLQPYVMRTIGVGAGHMLREVYRPALLPVPVMALVLLGLRAACDPTSLPAVAAVAAAGMIAYAAIYLGLSAPAEDRAAARTLVASLARAGRARAGGSEAP